MKTAVEYLVEQLMPKALTAEQYYHIEQAKEMEKDQRRQDFNESRDLIRTGSRRIRFKYESWEQYKNETFKSE